MKEHDEVESERKLGQHKKPKDEMKERGAPMSKSDHAKLKSQADKNTRRNDYVSNKFAGSEEDSFEDGGY